MKLLQLNVMRGPNSWSMNHHQLIIAKLDLADSNYYPSNTIDGFADRLETLLPGMAQHTYEGNINFMAAVRKGLSLAVVYQHIIIELLHRSGMDCAFSQLKTTGAKAIYNIAFSYTIERAGIYAAKAALKILAALEADLVHDLATDISELMFIHKKEGFGPSTTSIIEAAKRRDIPCTRLGVNSLVMLGQGANQKIIQATMASTTSGVAADLVSDKEATKRMLEESYIPVPNGKLVWQESDLQEAIDDIGFPSVIKPVDGNHGRGVTTNIKTHEEAANAFKTAQAISEDVIIEKFIEGEDYRFLVINYKVEAVAKRTPAMIIGDGKSTIEELINMVNSEPDRGDEHEKILTKIKIDGALHTVLKKRKVSLQHVLRFGEAFYLKETANLSTGGTATDVTDITHPANIFLAERIARLLNLDICGIDILTHDVTVPITNENGAVIEVNSGPGFRMHLSPTSGKARNVGDAVINMLYPPGSSSRIPLVAVTGTNGKTTTTRLIAHMAKQAGHTVGFTTTDGIYIKDQTIHEADCSGPLSAKVILRDPIVDYAVLECARGGILRSGLGFDKCNISITTNITEDHIGLDDINSLEGLVNVKSVVAKSTMDDGFAILNADDDNVYNIKNSLSCNIALFSMHANSPRIIEHCSKGGWAAIIEEDAFTLRKGKLNYKIANVKDIPLTLEGKALCMIKNVLPCILAGAVSGFDINTIKSSLLSFIPGDQMTPGRMNIFKIRGFEVMVDYVHNTDGFLQLQEFMNKVEAEKKVCIIGCAGDRRDNDIKEMGRLAAEIFDEIIIRHDKDGRGRENEAITQLIMQGIYSVKLMDVTVISDELEAVAEVINHAQPGSFIVVCAEQVSNVIKLVKSYTTTASSLVESAA